MQRNDGRREEEEGRKSPGDKHTLIQNTKSQKRIYNFVIEICYINACILEKEF